MAGHGDTEGHQYSPRLVEKLAGKRIVQLSVSCSLLDFGGFVDTSWFSSLCVLSRLGMWLSHGMFDGLGGVVYLG